MVVNSAPAVPRRIREFVRWVLLNPWPVFSLGLLQADIIAPFWCWASYGSGCRRSTGSSCRICRASTWRFHRLPARVVPGRRVGQLQPSARCSAGSAGTRCSPKKTQRRPSRLEARALRMPAYRSMIQHDAVAGGGRGLHRSELAGGQPIRAGDRGRHGSGAIATSIIGYLQSERVLGRWPSPPCAAGFRRTSAGPAWCCDWCCPGCSPPGCRC